MARMRDRPTGEVLIILIALTVCGYVVVATTVSIVFLFVHPNADIAQAFRNIADIINTLVGLLAGFFAGRSQLGRRNGNGNGNGTPKDPKDPPA